MAASPFLKGEPRTQPLKAVGTVTSLLLCCYYIMFGNEQHPN